MLTGLTTPPPGTEQAEAKAGQREDMAVRPDRDGKLQAVFTEKDAGQRPQCLFNRGQGLGQDEIPDEQLQQQRHISEEFDVGATERAQQDVARQSANADQGAEQGSEHNAHHSDAQGVS